jgi:hypothetical protein
LRWSRAANPRKDHAKPAGQKIGCAKRLLRFSLKINQADERRVAAIMTNINAFSSVGVAGMARTLHVMQANSASAHAAAAAITPRKPRTGTAIVASVNRGLT